MIWRLAFYGLAMALLALLSPPRQIRRPHRSITFQGNYLLHEGRRFNGILEERFDAAETIRKTTYRNGLADGPEEEFHVSGIPLAHREFSEGKKTGIHEGWFVNGKRRFHYEYQDGKPHGEYWEWYRSGALSLFARFEHGRLLGKKMWRESGQIYANYVFLPDRAVGVPGTQLCYQVRKDAKTNDSTSLPRETGE